MTKTWAPLLLAATLAVASPAAANQLQVSFGPYQNGSGGEFTLTVLNPDGWLDLSDYSALTSTATSFQSFCIEIGEPIYNGGIYDAALSLNASEFNDPISTGTALLYAAFATGAMGAYYDYADVTPGGRDGSAIALQEAIWILEDELAWDASSYYIDLLLTLLGGDETSWKANAAPGAGVRAVNLTTNGLARQDQLYYDDPSTTFRVPDGGTTLMLMGFALLGIAVLSRRFGLGSAR
jgi:hypothetical protein